MRRFTVAREVLERLRGAARGRLRGEHINQKQLAVETETFFARVSKAERGETGAWQRRARESWDRE